MAAVAECRTWMLYLTSCCRGFSAVVGTSSGGGWVVVVVVVVAVVVAVAFWLGPNGGRIICLSSFSGSEGTARQR